MHGKKNRNVFFLVKMLALQLGADCLIIVRYLGPRSLSKTIFKPNTESRLCKIGTPVNDEQYNTTS